MRANRWAQRHYGEFQFLEVITKQWVCEDIADWKALESSAVIGRLQRIRKML
jgi:hypothetical protein